MKLYCRKLRMLKTGQCLASEPYYVIVFKYITFALHHCIKADLLLTGQTSKQHPDCNLCTVGEK